jgi:phosphoribosylformylglycinamidine cyclo-ligase
MIHCSGGAQTKILHFLGDNLKVVKDRLFPVPPLFDLIQKQSGTDWKEMYKVFNMGHRMELYLSEEHAAKVIEISKSFRVDARIIGHVEKSHVRELVIESEFGRFKFL